MLMIFTLYGYFDFICLLFIELKHGISKALVK